MNKKMGIFSSTEHTHTQSLTLYMYQWTWQNFLMYSKHTDLFARLYSIHKPYVVALAN